MAIGKTWYMGKVKLILVFFCFSSTLFGQLSLSTIKSNFNASWAIEADRYLAISNNPDQGDIFYFYAGFDGNLAMFQATGDIQYLNNALTLFENKMKVAAPSNTLFFDGGKIGYNDKYLSWQDFPGGVTTGGTNNNDQTSLQEGHGFRNVPKMLWIMKKYPSIREVPGYQARYETALAFFLDHIWDKWANRDSGLITHMYRINTHMTSHWAQIGLYLYLITGDAKYRTVYDNYFTDMTAGGYSSSFLGNLRINAVVGTAWDYDSNWGGSGSQDHSHANADVQTYINSYLQGDYGDLSGIGRWISTFVDIISGEWDSSAVGFLNGGTKCCLPKVTIGDNRPFFDDGWVMLGRFSPALQNNLEIRNLAQTRASNYRSVFWGNMAYNRAYLDGTLVYPEYGDL